MELTRCPMSAGMQYSPGKFTGAPDARCLQGMLYSPGKFTGTPDARCLQGMLYSPVKFTGAPDARCLQGMRYSPGKFTGAPDARCLQGMHAVFPSEVHWGTRCPMFVGDAEFLVKCLLSYKLFA